MNDRRIRRLLNLKMTRQCEEQLKHAESSARALEERRHGRWNFQSSEFHTVGQKRAHICWHISVHIKIEPLWCFWCCLVGTTGNTSIYAFKCGVLSLPILWRTSLEWISLSFFQFYITLHHLPHNPAIVSTVRPPSWNLHISFISRFFPAAAADHDHDIHIFRRNGI